MNMKDVIISVTGVQQGVDGPDSMELVTAGKYGVSPDEIRLTWEESALTGMEGTRTSLTVQPGSVVLSHPPDGILPMYPRVFRYSSVSPHGLNPDALIPCSLFPDHTIAKLSLPKVVAAGSTTGSTIAIATHASIALPP